MAIFTKSKAPRDLIDSVDFRISFTVEKKQGSGEDCAVYSYNRDAAFFGVFDGCGGAGSQLCPRFNGKTEAYSASRAVGKAFEYWFDASNPADGRNAQALKELVRQELAEYDKRYGEKSLLMGGIKKKFPTTAAAGICCRGQGTFELDLYWAGDSRVYLLTGQGLAQLTEDDLGGIDAMENLSDDGILTNMVNLSTDFTIHTGHISMDRPGIIFAATDGCFGYLSTPMEFEYLLLRTLLDPACLSCDSEEADDAQEALLREDSPAGWERRLIEAIGKTAGDDYTLCGYALGFGSFDNMKNAFEERERTLRSRFISGLSRKSKAEKIELWQLYKDNYYRLICRP